MNEEICCIANEGKTVENEWKMLTPTFFELYAVYIKNWGNSFSIHYSLTCLNRDKPSCYKYFSKLISIQTLVLAVLKTLCICTLSL